jgi:hypothetical protein
MRTRIALLISLLVAVAVMGSVDLLSFRAYAVIDHCQLIWSTGEEGSLRQFVVERSSDRETFVPVGQVTARGPYSDYRFTDVSPLDADMNRTFYYRLKMVDGDGAYTFSEIRDVSLSFSAVQQTWGSIKALFR